MARRTYARRYAEAVFQIALAKEDFDGWQVDLNRLASALGDATVARFLENPRFPLADKDRIVSERFPGTNPLALNLVRLLISHDNLRALPDIAAEFQRLVDQHRGIGRARVITAIPLDERDRVTLTEGLGKLFDRQIKISAEVDPGIIGGLIVRVNGKLIDGSTRGRLLALRQEIAGAGGGE